MFPLQTSVRSCRPPVVTVALIIANAAVFLFEAGLSPEALEAFIHTFGLVPARQQWALAHAPARLDLWALPAVSSMFLHGGWAHIVGNMLFLWVFGDGVENRLGHGRFFAFYLLTGLAAGQAQVFAHPASQVPLVGASGAISGVLGSFLLLYPRAWVTLMVPVLFFPFFFELPALTFLLFWFFQQLVAGTVWALSDAAAQAGGVAWWAHVGGFAAGILLLGVFLDRHHKGYRQRRYCDPYAYSERY
ncbi:MAG: rhomboid family intramembrane serine protease [Planctomycetota bacterium]|nr:MAG: rhomboid family intramembrane serine protease [Planctomycetota bacterium]